MQNSITAHIHFNGNCTEALQFYHSCLGGDLYLHKISQSAMALTAPAGKANDILFGKIQHEQLQLLANDLVPEHVEGGNNFSLCLQCSSMQQLHKLFDQLSRGGSILTPLHQTIYGNSFGSFTDQFGIQWILQYYK